MPHALLERRNKKEKEPVWSPGSRTRREDRWRPESSYRAARPTPLDHAALKRKVHKDTIYERTALCAQKTEAEDRWALRVLQDLLGCTRTKGKPQATESIPGLGRVVVLTVDEQAVDAQDLFEVSAEQVVQSWERWKQATSSNPPTAIQVPYAAPAALDPSGEQRPADAHSPLVHTEGCRWRRVRMPCCGQLVINDLCRNHLCPDWDGSVELFDPMDPHRPGSCPCSTPPPAFGDPPTHYEGDAPSDRDGRSAFRQEIVTAAQHPPPGPEAPELMGPGTAADVDDVTTMAEMLDSENAFQAIDTPAHSHSREGTWEPMESMPRDKYQSFLDSRPG